MFAIPIKVRIRAADAGPPGSIYWSRPDGSGYDALPTAWDGVMASVSHFSTGFLAVANAGPDVNGLTSPVTVSGTISGGPLPASTVVVVVTVLESDGLCGLPSGGCTPFQFLGGDYHPVATVDLPPSLPATYSVSIPPPSVGDAGTYVVSRYFSIRYAAYDAQSLTTAGGSLGGTCAYVPSGAPLVCDASFATPNSSEDASVPSDAEDGIDTTIDATDAGGGSVSDTDAAPDVNGLTSPVSGTISGGPWPASTVVVVVTVSESDALCGLPPGGCTPFQNAGAGLRDVVTADLPPTLPATYSVSSPAPSVGDAGAYVVGRYFTIHYAAYDAQSGTTASGSLGSTCAYVNGLSGAPLVCNGAF